MKKLFTIFVLAISGLIFMAAQSHAVSIWFDNNEDFSGGGKNWTYDLSQDVPDLAASMNVDGGGGGDLTRDLTDKGLGIGDDEITGGTSEAITFSFSQPLFVKSFYLVDLFPNEGDTGERAFYSLNGGLTFVGPSSSGDIHGNYSLLLNSKVNEIIFSANSEGFGRWNDYAVAGFEFEPAPVPEPGTLLLLGIGLFGVGYFGWKRRYFEK